VFRGSTFRISSAYARLVPLPESIPVRYTEEEAGYVTFRPVVRQTFRLYDLLDMVLSVTGKDAPRIRQILRSGTVVYHFYRYWWTGFDADEGELRAALALFPGANAERPFSQEHCALAIFEGAGANPKPLLELDRAAGSERRLFRKESFWGRLLEIAGREHPAYETYSYVRRADLYRLELNEQRAAEIAAAAERFAPGKLRAALRILPGAARIVFVCSRPGGSRPAKTPPPEKPNSQ
jgi:hypothetical protein